MSGVEDLDLPPGPEIEEVEEIEEDLEEIITDGHPTGPSPPKPKPAPLPIITSAPGDFDEEEDEEDFDESLAERLWALSEMFPESLRNITSGATDLSIAGTMALYSVARVGLWVIASSAVVLALPVILESERSQVEEMEKNQKRQILLGPSAAVSGGGPPMPGMMPQIAPPSR